MTYDPHGGRFELEQPDGSTVVAGYVPPRRARNVTPGAASLPADDACPFGFVDCLFTTDPHVHLVGKRRRDDSVMRLPSWTAVVAAMRS